MFVKKLKDISKSQLNEVIKAIVLLLEVKVKTAKNDKRYADLIIQDATKMLEVKYWDYEDNRDFIDSLLPNEIIQIEAIVGEYQGQLQLTIKHIERVEKDINMEDLIPASSWGLEKLKKGLEYFYEKVETPHLKRLLDEMIFCEEYYEKFCTYPAARQIHHNYYYGLLQHTLEVLKFAYTVAATKNLSKLQQERLIVMAMLHDWAKIMEYKPLPGIGFTEEGSMLGHIFLGAHTTLNKINEIEDFEHEDKLIIINGILGHHGKLEFGSPVMPKTIEAQILHHADLMSGDIESIKSFIEDQEEDGDAFTKKLWNIGTEFYKGTK